MPFTFKLAKRLALSKAVRTTATRALSALRQASTGPAVLGLASLLLPPRTSAPPLQSRPRVSWCALSCQKHHC